MTLTGKQEAFCLAYIEFGNASEAYRRAYNVGSMPPQSIHRKAKEVMDNVKVASRLAELRKPAADAAVVTLQGHLKRLHELAEAAEKEGKFSAAVTAEIARGKASGLYVERIEASGPGGGPIESKLDASALSVEQLRALSSIPVHSR